MSHARAFVYIFALATWLHIAGRRMFYVPRVCLRASLSLNLHARNEIPGNVARARDADDDDVDDVDVGRSIDRREGETSDTSPMSILSYVPMGMFRFVPIPVAATPKNTDRE